MRLVFITIISVCLAGCTIGHVPNSAQLWHVPRSQVSSLPSSDSAVIKRMASGTVTAKEIAEVTEIPELHLATENPVNRYQPLAGEMVDKDEAEMPAPLIADAIELEQAGPKPIGTKALLASSPKKLTQPEPEPLPATELVPEEETLSLDLETALKMAGGIESAKDGKLLTAALHYLDMVESIHHSRILHEALKDMQSLAATSSELALSAEEHRASAERLQTQILLLQSERQEWEGNIAKTTNALRRTIGIEADVRIVPIGLMVAPIRIVPAASTAKSLLSTAFFNRSEFQDSPSMALAAWNAYENTESRVLPSVLLNRSSIGKRQVEKAQRVRVEDANGVSLASGAFDTDDANRIATLGQDKALELMDSVAVNVGDFHAEIVSNSARIEILQQAIEAAEKSVQRSLNNLEKAKCTVSEAQQSISALFDARQSYLEAVMDHNRAQFQLQHAMGWPSSIETVNSPAPIEPPKSNPLRKSTAPKKLGSRIASSQNRDPMDGYPF